MVSGAPEQHTTLTFATANGGQQVLFGVQALLDSQGQGLIAHRSTLDVVFKGLLPGP